MNFPPGSPRFHPHPQWVKFRSAPTDNGVKAAKHRLRWLNEDEEAEFLRQLDPQTPVQNSHIAEIWSARQDAHDLAIMYLNMGPRYNEFASLRWDDINLRKREISLYRTKTDNESTLYMPDVVYTVLSRRAANRRQGQVYVFESKDKEGHRKYATRAFESAYRRAGISDATIHTMRHTFAAKFVQNGGSLYELQQLLGHSSATTTEIYAHLAPNQGSIRAAQIMNKLNA